MHPGPPPQANKAPPPAQENGGEGENGPNTVNVTTSCTDVCGPGEDSTFQSTPQENWKKKIEAAEKDDVSINCSHDESLDIHETQKSR
ncbi:uncharacterized protein LOC110367407 isoform X2 [Fundulus heteroclitus]|uniref:uncharacterized protein LOC110367407 isoform X2 n=1 Tax=Fundulus heteroclitus TaxID=8078 RepID=UPI00165BB50D|nr:uncharacterized protein LOC110367407 isoform X2 [Fundulus heteroclitus]